MKKHIPNMITCCNLISGCIATVLAVKGLMPLALLMIIAGAVFDFFDGMTARLLGVGSPIGKELDSLADDITFGLAPSAMVFATLQDLPCPAPLAAIADGMPYVAFVMAAFSALRLAKFNLDERQTTSFIGLPTPANALFWASLLTACQTGITAYGSRAYIIILVGVVVSCYLLVAEIPMFALKFKSLAWQGNELRHVYVVTALLLIIALGTLGIAAAIAWYVVLSVAQALRKSN